MSQSTRLCIIEPCGESVADDVASSMKHPSSSSAIDSSTSIPLPIEKDR